jgi:hypothetical protein
LIGKYQLNNRQGVEYSHGDQVPEVELSFGTQYAVLLSGQVTHEQERFGSEGRRGTNVSEIMKIVYLYFYLLFHIVQT